MKMQTPPLQEIGPLEIHNGPKNFVYNDIKEFEEGLHILDDVFLKMDKNKKVSWVASRQCDHNGGKLLPTRDCKKARCPNHGWELNLENLSYTNVKEKKQKCGYSVNHGQVRYEVTPRHLVMPGRESGKSQVKMRFLAHACVAFDIEDFRLVTDPWLVGPCFTTGWWHAHPPKEDALEILQNASMIYISHNHPDHLHPETLSYLNKDLPIITPAFDSQSTEKVLVDLGFTNVHSLPFNMAFGVEGISLQLSILPSGDFRDDSGIFLTSRDFSALLTVDSNSLNCGVLPEGVDLLMTAFAGGSSGYPLCFENKSRGQHRKLTQVFRKSFLKSVLRDIHIVKPKHYVPYAGFFREAAERDKVIFENNVKNSQEEVFEEISKFPFPVRCINPLENDELIFSGDEVIQNHVNIPRLYEVNDHYVKTYVDGMKKQYQQNSDQLVFQYFEGSAFKNTLVLLLQPTNDEFLPEGSGFEVDFRGDTPVVREKSPEIIQKKYERWRENSSIKLLFIKVRRESLFYVIKNFLPWEYLSIGFQCRIFRKPDVYNNEFWQHFNDIYIGRDIVAQTG